MKPMETAIRSSPRLPLSHNNPGERARFEVGLATADERETIFEMRHEVYAREIGQHPMNAQGRLTDALDEVNIYLVARCAGEVAGFVSLTPPGAGTGYSIDKYFRRDDLPFAVDEGLFEVRLLTVRRKHRGTKLAALLMYAAFRWVEAHGGTHLVAIGRREVLSVYLKSGLADCGKTVQSGAVHYHLLHADLAALRGGLEAGSVPLDLLERETRWTLDFPLRRPAACFHGGAFFEAIGPRFDRLQTVQTVINADVLDAWFPPAPKVLEALTGHLPWMLRTSPPTSCEGLIDTIAFTRGVKPENILVGAGSSDLIFRALPRWLNAESRVLLLDPTYGEYAHMLEKVIGCRVDRLTLRRECNYQVPMDALETALTVGYDLVVLVNPNSPTGQHVSADVLAPVLQAAPAKTRVWVDETYVDFVDSAQSLERMAARSENVIVCKSMSKAYALSGARVAYLCAGPHQLEELRAFTPPWAVSLVAQVAGVRALESAAYYADRWRETSDLREPFAEGLGGLGWQVVPGVANFLLSHLPEDGPTAADVVARCRDSNLFLRDASRMGARLGAHALRLAVKDAETNAQMLNILRRIV
jgi:histidinol-phosphate/aromatic aminotransferase/cobyric acid decarboxylase-like protein/GNAT superfamily N-acetyltransferase